MTSHDAVKHLLEMEPFELDVERGSKLTALIDNMEHINRNNSILLDVAKKSLDLVNAFTIDIESPLCDFNEDSENHVKGHEFDLKQSLKNQLILTELSAKLTSMWLNHSSNI